MSSALEFGPFRLEPENRVLLREGTPVALTPKAFETLVVLVEWRARVATKPELLQRVWPEQFVEENNLAQQIFTLRKVLGDDPEGHEYIRTVPRVGYQFAASVTVVPARPAPPPLPPEPERGTAGPRPRRRTALFATLAAVAALGAAGLAWIAHPAGTPGPPALIAVLPFANTGPSADDDYLAEGITEELLTELARRTWTEGRSLPELLAEEPLLKNIDLDELTDPARYTGAAAILTDRALERR